MEPLVPTMIALFGSSTSAWVESTAVAPLAYVNTQLMDMSTPSEFKCPLALTDDGLSPSTSVASCRV